ncbi:MAG: hypothetical protein K8S56_01070 [Candidatus Cloacimonetes bacterium]|nr:hypothetical protein [Candidatus Cloacimonadota bacterium]
MALSKLASTLSTKISEALHIKLVFGNPVTASGKTIIPVAKIGFGFGSGGSFVTPSSEENKQVENGGGGGGGSAEPLGVFEISDSGTRFIPVITTRQIIFISLFVLITLRRVFRRKKRKK